MKLFSKQFLNVCSPPFTISYVSSLYIKITGVTKISMSIALEPGRSIYKTFITKIIRKFSKLKSLVGYMECSW